MSDEDRRSYPRVGFKVPAHIYVGSAGTLYKGYVLNLSEAGVFVMMDKDVAVGKHIEMQFELPPGKTTCEAVGRIAHAMDMGAYQGLGVELTETNPPYVNFLRNLAVASPGDILQYMQDMKRITVKIS